VRDKRELVRVAHTPDDRYVVDPHGKLPGRGAYVCPTAECLALAVKRKSFDRAFRQPLPKEAVAALEAGLQEYLNAQAAPERAAGADPNPARPAGATGG
jgi:predicted RNA-binding protein YlxR (DUF448 family)